MSRIHFATKSGLPMAWLGYFGKRMARIGVIVTTSAPSTVVSALPAIGRAACCWMMRIVKLLSIFRV